MAPLISLFSQGTANAWVVAKDGPGILPPSRLPSMPPRFGNTVPVNIPIRKGGITNACFGYRKTGCRACKRDANNTFDLQQPRQKSAAQRDTVNTWTSPASLLRRRFRAENLTSRTTRVYRRASNWPFSSMATGLPSEIAGWWDFRMLLFLQRDRTETLLVLRKLLDAEGTTDFIFGPSTAVFVQCHIHSKKKSHVTAASTPRKSLLVCFFDRQADRRPHLKNIS
ncbi:MAG: hypothetical protein IPK21_13735 [Haliscomenobacter sp.]|nr:hypothetical protein [Haliscomenobacter sp.]